MRQGFISKPGFHISCFLPRAFSLASTARLSFCKRPCCPFCSSFFQDAVSHKLLPLPRSVFKEGPLPMLPLSKKTFFRKTKHIHLNKLQMHLLPSQICLNQSFNRGLLYCRLPTSLMHESKKSGQKKPGCNPAFENVVKTALL